MSGECDENKDAPSNPAENEAADNNGSSGSQLPPVIATPDPPPPPANPNPANQNSHEWRENTKLVLEVIGVVLLLVYTVFTALQWSQIRWTNRLTREALNGSDEALKQTLGKMQAQVNATWASITQSHQQFGMEQRPYLAEKSGSFEKPIVFSNPNTPGKVQIVWSWYMTNYGKSPANQIVMNQEMSTDGGETFFPSYGGSGKVGGKAHDIGGSDPPGYDSFDTVLSAPMQTDEANKILNSPAGVAMRVRITYQDMSGTGYETSICHISGTIGAVTICKQSNYIH
jgi:hypothetical protein